MKAKSRNTLRVPGWFKRRKEGVRSRITHKIYQSFALGLISIKISNTRRIDSKIELLFNQFAIWLMREQIVTEPIWRLSHPSRVRGLKFLVSWKPAVNCVIIFKLKVLTSILSSPKISNKKAGSFLTLLQQVARIWTVIFLNQGVRPVHYYLLFKLYQIFVTRATILLSFVVRRCVPFSSCKYPSWVCAPLIFLCPCNKLIDFLRFKFSLK